MRFNAVYCDGALKSAAGWELSGHNLVAQMEKARRRGYQADDDLIKNVGRAKWGALLELRVYGEGRRMFFSPLNGEKPKIIIGGFYSKNMAQSQNEAIETAAKRLNSLGGSSAGKLRL